MVTRKFAEVTGLRAQVVRKEAELIPDMTHAQMFSF